VKAVLHRPRTTMPRSRGALGGVGHAALAERVFVQLRSDILHARLRPGDALSENSLAHSMAVSRTPVREAVQRLVREGLVQVLPQRGSYVARLSMQRIRDALFVREAVEGQIVRRFLDAPPNVPALQELDACIARQAAALAAKDIDAVLAADETFHKCLLDSCGLGGVWPIVAQARDMHQRTRAIALPELQSGARALADHRAIVAALRKRDPELASRAMQQHLGRNEPLMLDVAALHPDYFEEDGHADTGS
jgi:GntR family transcriptional regulator, rspAB operon transcriptional repressor